MPFGEIPLYSRHFSGYFHIYPISFEGTYSSIWGYSSCLDSENSPLFSFDFPDSLPCQYYLTNGQSLDPIFRVRFLVATALWLDFSIYCGRTISVSPISKNHPCSSSLGMCPLWRKHVIIHPIPMAKASLQVSRTAYSDWPDLWTHHRTISWATNQDLLELKQVSLVAYLHKWPSSPSFNFHLVPPENLSSIQEFLIQGELG
jgi:hypothetical protein